MKRVTYWPQFVLGKNHSSDSILVGHIVTCHSSGLAFNWGALLGWSAVAGVVNWQVCLPLYASGVCWTLVYDSIYAHQVCLLFFSPLTIYMVSVLQDKSDDVTVGIRSTALLFRENTRPVLFGLSVSSISLFTLAGYMNTAGIPFYTGVGLAGLQLARVVARTDFDNRASCWKGFTGCGWAGFWMWMGGMADYLLILS